MNLRHSEEENQPVDNQSQARVEVGSEEPTRAKVESASDERFRLKKSGLIRRRAIESLMISATALAVGYGIVFHSSLDYVPAVQDLPAAEKAYRDAGFPWTAAELMGPQKGPESENAAPDLKAAISEMGPHDFKAPEVESLEDVPVAKEELENLGPALTDAVAASNKPFIDFTEPGTKGQAFFSRNTVRSKASSRLLTPERDARLSSMTMQRPMPISEPLFGWVVSLEVSHL